MVYTITKHISQYSKITNYPFQDGAILSQTSDIRSDTRLRLWHRSPAQTTDYTYPILHLNATALLHFRSHIVPDYLN